jgi:hypothetical protein
MPFAAQLRPPAKPDEPSGSAEAPAGEPMTIRSDEAAAMLANVESVGAGVKQSTVYPNAALIIILWDVVPISITSPAPAMSR